MDTSNSKLWRLGLVIAALVTLAILTVWLNYGGTSRRVTVGIIEPLQHIAVSDVTRGIRDGLKPADARILVQNANGDKATIAQIISQYKDKNTDIFVPIFTGTSQATKSLVPGQPIVFAAVTDPIAAGLLTQPAKLGDKITGVSDLWPIAAELSLIHRIVPGAKTIGVVYDPGDPSAAATLPLLQAEARKQGFTLELRPVHAAHEIPQALALLVGKIDILFTANDVTVTSAFPALVSFSVQNKVPLFAGDYSSVRRGAIAAVGQNYYNVGLEAAKLIKEILNGRSPDSLPVVYTSGGDVYINSSAAKQMGVTVPADTLRAAKEVYTEITEKDGDRK